MDIALLDLISTEPAYLDSIPISPGRLIAVSNEGSPNKGELYWDAEDGTRKCIGSDISEIEELLGNKADLVDGKVKKEQLPEIQTDQVVEQTDTPTSPNTILWVDTDAETPGVDIEGIKATAEGAKAEAELAHATADSAITSINTVSESIKTLENKVDERFTEYDATFQETGESITKIEGQIANISVPNFSDSVEIMPTFYAATTSHQGSANAIGNMLYIAITFTLTNPINPTTPASSTNICDFTIPDLYSFESKYAIFKVPYLDNGVVKTEFSIYPKYNNSISIFSNNMAIEAGHEISVYAYIPLVPKVKP